MTSDNLLKKYKPEELKHLQKLELKILNETIRICDKYGLKYYIFCGTALGAIRHEGFIPWDDDVDIAMFRKDYDKLLDILKDELSEEYGFLNMTSTEDYFFTFTKICLKGTKFEDWLAPYVSYSENIYIDIFPLDYLPKSEFKQKLYHYRCKLFDLLLFYSVIKFKNGSSIRNLMRNIIHFTLNKIITRKFIKKQFLKTLTKYNLDKNEFVTCYFLQTSIPHFGKYGYFDKKDFEPSKTIKFEDINVNIPNNTHNILTKFYGNYMTLPPENKRYNHAPETLDFGKY